MDDVTVDFIKSKLLHTHKIIKIIRQKQTRKNY